MATELTERERTAFRLILHSMHNCKCMDKTEELQEFCLAWRDVLMETGDTEIDRIVREYNDRKENT